MPDFINAESEVVSYGFQPPYPTRFEPWTKPPGGLPDGRNWRLLEPLNYRCKDGRLLRTSLATLTDGGSIPREFWPLLSPFDYWCCFVMHDAAFKDTLEILSEANKTWNQITLTMEESDVLLDECLESRGCEILERRAIFDVLQKFGKTAFEQDRAGNIVPTPTKC